MERNGRESRLAQAIATYLEKQVRGVRVQAGCNLLYSCVVGERDGKLILDVDDEGDVHRHGGAYQQDILLYDEVDGGKVRQIPRVAIELKASDVTTHDAIVYAEKTRRLRTIYPYLRYLFVAVAHGRRAAFQAG